MVVHRFATQLKIHCGVVLGGNDGQNRAHKIIRSKILVGLHQISAAQCIGWQGFGCIETGPFVIGHDYGNRLFGRHMQADVERRIRKVHLKSLF